MEWARREGMGSMGVKGENPRILVLFPIGLCRSWSVTCSMQLVELGRLNDWKDHFFVEQWATESMEGRTCTVWGSDVYIQAVPRGNTSGGRVPFGRAQRAASLGEGIRKSVLFFFSFPPLWQWQGHPSKQESPHVGLGPKFWGGEASSTLEIFPVPLRPAAHFWSHCWVPCQAPVRSLFLPGIVPISFPCLGLLLRFRAAQGGIPKAASESR